MLTTFKLRISLNTVWITLQKIFVSQLETMVFSSRKKTYPLAIFGCTTIIHRLMASKDDSSYMECARPFCCRSFGASKYTLVGSFFPFAFGSFCFSFAFIFYIHSIVRSIPFDTYFHSNILFFIRSISFSPPPTSSPFAQLPMFSVFHTFDKYIYI